LVTPAEPDRPRLYRHTQLYIEISAYLFEVGKNIGAFGQDYPSFFPIMERLREPRFSSWLKIGQILSAYYDKKAITLDLKGRHKLRQRLLLVAPSIVKKVDEPPHITVDAKQLELLYSFAKQGGTSQEALRVLELSLRQYWLGPEEALAHFAKILALVEERYRPHAMSLLASALEFAVGAKRIEKGCTTIRLEVTPELARHLIAAVQAARQRGDLPDGILSLRDVGPSRRRLLDPRTPDLRGADEAAAERIFRRLWFRLRLRQMLTEPWRHLRWLLSPHVKASPIADVIHRSGYRAYAIAAADRDHHGPLWSDLVVAWLVWPGLSAVLILATLWLLQLWAPGVAVGAGAISGLVLALAGGQICSFVIAPTAAGAGAIFIAWAFAIAHALSIGPLLGTDTSAPTIAGDLFTAVTGGVVGLAAPNWLSHLSLLTIASIILLIAGSIAMSGWFMAQPMHAGPYDRLELPERLERLIRPTRLFAAVARWRKGNLDLLGIACAMLVGASIGLVKGLTELAVGFGGIAPAAAFGGAYASIGALVFAATIWLAMRRPFKTCCLYALGYFLGVSLLCYLATNAPAPFNLMFLASLSAIYHSTWFTGTFVVGSLFSRRAAVVGAALEGAGGFSVFVILRMVSVA
jgi:hypothetical protein